MLTDQNPVPEAQLALGDDLAAACADLESLEALLTTAVADTSTPTSNFRELSIWAERRIGLQAQATALERRAMAALARAGISGRRSLDDLSSVAPQVAAELRTRVDAVRARLEELRARDQRRAMLVNRCREIVGRYLGVIDPPVRAYGRDGAQPASSERHGSVRSSVQRSA